MNDMNLPKLVEQFRSEEKCRSYLEALRWPQKVACPRCASVKISRIASRSQFDCDSCRYQFSVTAGTIFHDSHLPLWKWLLAIYMMAEAKKGVSANQLKRTLAVSYKTAWYLCHRIRAAMKDSNPIPLDGIVEMDETFLGGKRRGVGRGSKVGKRVIVGAADRDDGTVRLRLVPAARKVYTTKFIRDVVDPKATIYSDESELYSTWALRGREHQAVNHSAGEYVRADVHTNSVEGVWSLFKRSVIGSYHQLSTKHLPAYLDETAFRYNNRNNPFLFRDTVLKLIGSESLTYKILVSAGRRT